MPAECRSLTEHGQHLLLSVFAFGPPRKSVGLTSFWVGQRRKQLGVRRALGMTKHDILSYFLTENLLTGAVGLLGDRAGDDVVVLIHPNNCGAKRYDVAALVDSHAALRQRVGFVAAAPALLDRLRERLVPWTPGSPTHHVLRHALADRSCQSAMGEQLPALSACLAGLLSVHGLAPSGSCALFQWVRHAKTERLHRALARRAVLVRLFDVPASARFGLPLDEAAFARLDLAPSEATAELLG